MYERCISGCHVITPISRAQDPAMYECWRRWFSAFDLVRLTGYRNKIVTSMWISSSGLKDRRAGSRDPNLRRHRNAMCVFGPAPRTLSALSIIFQQSFCFIYMPETTSIPILSNICRRKNKFPVCVLTYCIFCFN